MRTIYIPNFDKVHKITSVNVNKQFGDNLLSKKFKFYK